METLNHTYFQFAYLAGRIGFPRHSLTLILKGTFTLKSGGKAVPADEQFFPTGNELYPDDDEGNGSCRYESDFAYFKPRADLLLAGKCYAPGGRPVPACKASFQVGSQGKTLAVFGNRKWNPTTRTISDPEPFTEMELRYENSFGGAKYDKNPVGKGLSKIVQESGISIWPLPNIEDIHHLIDSPASRPEPSGFGPLGMMWEQRYKKLGTYGGDYIQSRWPWYPEDFDWTYFNAAPSDMQVEGYLKGDESIHLENLHPTCSDYKSQLPGVRPRLFINKQDAKKNEIFSEIPLQLDTLWVDGESEKLVLVWRGVTEILSEDYEEITHSFIVSEKIPDAAAGKEYYHEKFLRLRAEETAADAVEPEEAAPADSSVSVEAKIKQAEAQIRAALLEAGIDPDEELPEPSDADKATEAAILKELGLGKREEPPRLTREIVAAKILNGESMAGVDLRGIDLSGLVLHGADFRNAILAGVNLQNTDLSNSDFTNADLSTANFFSAILTDAILLDTDLTQADLENARLTDANITNAVFDKANLKHAKMDKSAADGASFVGADLSNASLADCTCRAADFSGSRLSEADFTGSRLIEASVEGAEGIRANMTGADLTGLRASDESNFNNAVFRDVIAPYSIWEDASLDGADFSFAVMEGANFASASLKSATFLGADLRFARFSKANLFEARCLMMNCFQANFERADLTGSDFRSSNMYGAEFLNVVINRTRFDQTNLKMTKLSHH